MQSQPARQHLSLQAIFYFAATQLLQWNLECAGVFTLGIAMRLRQMRNDADNADNVHICEYSQIYICGNADMRIDSHPCASMRIGKNVAHGPP